MTKYDKKRHIELLKGFLDFKNQGKDLYTENRNEYMELLEGTYSSKAEQKIHETSYSYNESTRQIAGFNKETGDIITAGKYSPRAFDRFLDTKHLGRL